MNPDRIKDIPSFKNTLDEIHSFEQFDRVFPLLKPALRLLNVDVAKLQATLAEVRPLAENLDELSGLPDRFNDMFASRGWIMYDRMNVNVAKAAIQKAEGGDVDGAEQDLVTYYDVATVRMTLMSMHAVRAFQPRLPLALKALEDYSEGRYHACVPVILALLDGMVNELGPRGFFAEGVNLEAWDSIAAHSSGLAELAKLLGKTRRKTTTESLTIPYRHGILHGHDLGYDNQMVAAKAWAALFATREWALKLQNGQVTEPPTQPRPSWRDLVRQLRENADDKVRLEAWAPRTIQVGEDIPASGSPEDYADETPEQLLVEFLICWRGRNYGHMARCLSGILTAQGHSLNRIAGELRAQFGDKQLMMFRLLDVHDTAPAITVIRTEVIYEKGGSEQERAVEFRLVHEDATGHVSVRGKPTGTWKVLGYPV